MNEKGKKVDCISVLVVDDEQFVCESLILKFSKLHHKCDYLVRSCNNGEEALELVTQTQYELIITDINMPYMNGIDLIIAIRKMGFQGKIMVLSGFDDFNYVRNAFVNGADDYLLKPFALSELDQKVRSLAIQSSKSSTTRLQDSNREAGKNDFVERAVEYIETNYNNSHLSMEEVSKHLSLSYSYFSALFRKEMNQTFPSYLREVRIGKAIELLDNPNIKISVICYRVGFKYPQQFSKEFKRVTGYYPSDYLNNMQDLKRNDETDFQMVKGEILEVEGVEKENLENREEKLDDT